MKIPLVSILSPCWNGERFLDRYFQCLLDQTYENLEIVLVNDGSTDATRQIIEQWRPKLEGRGWTVKVFHQENQGVCSAVNFGLKHVTGDYLLWPDPDDTLDPDAIEKRVDFLESNPEYGFTRSECRLYIEEKDEFAGYVFNRGRPKEKQCFNEYLLDEFLSLKVLPYPVAFMVSMTALRAVNPEMEIYVHPRAGQNFQILGPVAARYLCGFMAEPDCTYYQNQNSHSRRGKTLEKRNAMSDAALECVLATLKRMPIDYEKYSHMARMGSVYQKFNNAFRKKRCYSAIAPFSELVVHRRATLKIWAKMLLLFLISPLWFLKRP